MGARLFYAFFAPFASHFAFLHFFYRLEHMVTIVQKDDPILRKIAKPVTKSMFGTPALHQIIVDMKAAVDSQDDAVAIAAPQIGKSLRIFIVAGKVFDLLGQKEPNLDETVPGNVPAEAAPKEAEDLVFINPEIVKLSRERKEMEEGCLSVRYLYGKTMRAKKAKVRAQDEQGRWFEIGGTGLLAQIFQHETDHLAGELFIDKATEIEDLPPENDKPAGSKRKHVA